MIGKKIQDRSEITEGTFLVDKDGNVRKVIALHGSRVQLTHRNSGNIGAVQSVNALIKRDRILFHNIEQI